jgi:hypothetical protein
LAIAEQVVQEVLTALQQIQWAEDLLVCNGVNTECYQAIITRNEARLEIWELEIISVQERSDINEFQRFRDALFRELELIRSVKFKLRLGNRQSREIAELVNEKTIEIKAILERIKRISEKPNI